jgi:hypothetical protein
MLKEIFSKINWSSKFTFPIIVLFILFLLTAFKISGSSIGPFYDTYFDGKYSSNLVTGLPRGVRTDEWLVTTQLTIAQKAAGFPLVNENIGQGKNMSLISDVPYFEWSALFKPQNFSFFVLPLENAFAFKWWFLLAALLISTYFLALRFLQNKKLIASLISIIFSFSPFIFWWYQSITITPIIWIIVVLIFAMRLIDDRPLPIFNSLKVRNSDILSKALLVLGLSYSAIAFGLVLYPAFQVPLAIVALFFLIGYWLNNNRKNILKSNTAVRRSLVPLFVGGLIALGVIGGFVLTRIDAIRDITGTVYPGSRNVESGGVGGLHMLNLVSFDQYRLLDDKIQSDIQGIITSNQSEMSSFMVLSFLYIIPLLLLGIWKWYRYKKIDWIIAGLMFGNAIIYAHLLLPFFTPISKLLFLQTVPVIRLFIGMGLLGILSLIYTIHVIQKYKTELVTYIKPFTISYAVVLILIYSIAVLYIQKKFPSYLGDIRILLLVASFYIAGIIGTLHPKPVYGLVILALMSIIYTSTVQPLYKGLGPIYNNQITSTIQRLSTKEAVWGVNEDILLENLPTIANRNNVSGTQFSPDNEYWDKIQNNDNDIIYNRYAHVLLSDNQDEQLQLVQADYFTAKISCTNLVGQTVTHILSKEALDFPCYELADTIVFSNKTLYFYKKH